MSVPEGPRDFAVIPDLHGRLDVLESMLRACGFVDARGLVLDSGLHLVQLGDLVDRGPHPRACVERVMDLRAAAPERVHALMGNHEAMLLAADQNPMAKRLWMTNGGSRTLADYEGAYESWIQPGGRHFQWMKSLPPSFEFKNVLFCHAGLAKARKGQLHVEGILWDRPPLTKGAYRAVVCGHTPTASGRIEEHKGVWRCDLGLGHGTEKSLEMLILSIGEQSLVARKVGP
ncbi:MAG: metallophosphoesterase [bacterium]